MPGGYFAELTRTTPTRWFINNPTSAEAALAIENGAVCCTTNPTYSAGQIKRDADAANSVIDACVADAADDGHAADLVQQRLIARLLKPFARIHEASGGDFGWVAIQGNPNTDDDPDAIVHDALRFRNAAGPNLIVKVPATQTGLLAFERLVAEDVPTIVTESFAVSQMIHFCETYERVSSKYRRNPALFVTQVTGIFDEFLAVTAKAAGHVISPGLIAHAGLAVARKWYQVHKERRYPGVLLGGGARHTRHFTGLIGGDLCITINWSFAEELIANPPPIAPQLFDTTEPHLLNELLALFPDFVCAWSAGALAPESFREYGPVAYFREQFVKGWDTLVDAVKSRRALASRERHVSTHTAPPAG